MAHEIFRELLARRVIDEARFQECVQAAEEGGEPLDRVLRARGGVSEEALLELYRDRLGLELLPSLTGLSVPDAFVRRVPAQFARAHNLVAVGQENGTFRVASCDPLDLPAVDDLANMLDAEVETVLAPRTEITGLLNRSYRVSADGVDEMLSGLEDDDILGVEKEIEGVEDVLDIANKAPVIKLVNMILFEALKGRASDIHFQPYEDKVQVRYRIDGILYDMKVIPKKVQEAVISRVKVMGKMDIAERRRPQGGRTTIRVGDGEVDLRISSVPTSSGERLVLRILDKTSKVYTLEEIGLSAQDMERLQDVIHLPNGIVFVTGPTGSGKTTTLYACITRINSHEKNVLTIEDPIEYHLPGVSQIQVNVKAGLTFAAGLRELLRQDPDVMMVGEVRDEETSRIAIQSALTGHLVFSTIHTNDAPAAMTRLVDIGVEPYLVASSVVCVVAQRLVRLICNECKDEYEPTENELTEVGLTPDRIPEGSHFCIGMGCKTCFDTGYLGRTAIYEILQMDETIRALVTEKAGASRIKHAAVSAGMRTLRMDGARKVLEGRTTIEEVLRVTQMDTF
ncbi:MAG: Flp pilus assembly complex ATPase component TadA [Planctomycetes bacterium]|nr:Flp pilus assembly complex ATPase component TadA [Planctomycetota bacterium]